jgi:NET1-associated nuclear protein 1 (U3 small nucleolar RNA-associated protein 17)
VLLAQPRSIKVYAAKTSLAVRTLSVRSQSTIAAFALSACNPSYLYIALSSGRIEHWDWESGSRLKAWDVNAELFSLQVADLREEEESHDILYVADSAKGGHSITAHRFQKKDAESVAEVRTLLKTKGAVSRLQVLQDGQIIVAATEKHLIIGSRKGGKSSKQLSTLHYNWREFEYTRQITSLDARVDGGDVDRPSKRAQVDIAVGTDEGAIMLYHDIQAQLQQVEQQKQIAPQANKLHWHRNAVGSLKWSLDGNYIISGGLETVLVLWQLDTGKKQLLPHLSSEIQSVVVSPSGDSYAIRLADNSTMVLSTLELEPTAHIPGIQVPDRMKYSLGSRAANSATLLSMPYRRMPFASSKDSAHLLFAVPATTTTRLRTKENSSAPFLQVLDSKTGTQVAKQALVRTNVTDRNTSPRGDTIAEPNVVLLRTSQSGKWLATVDEWMPPSKDIEHMVNDDYLTEHERKRRLESHLKIWVWNEEARNWELSWRVDGPHTVNEENVISYGMVLDLISDPSGEGFYTLGDDGGVKRWHPKSRLRNNLVVRDRQNSALASWTAESVGLIPLPLAMSDTVSSPQYLAGRLAISHDGSVLAASLDMGAGANVCTFDAKRTGSAGQHLNKLSSKIADLGFMDRHLIVIGEELTVWDLVDDCLVYKINLKMPQPPREDPLWTVQLCLDDRNGTFMVAIDDIAGESSTKVAVFNPRSPTPLYITNTPHPIIGMVPDPSRKGYVVIDSRSEIRHIVPSAQLPDYFVDTTSASETPSTFRSLGGVFGASPVSANTGDSRATAPFTVESGDSGKADQHEISDIWSGRQPMMLEDTTTIFKRLAALITKRPVQVT